MSTSPQGTGLGRRLASHAVATAVGRVVVLAMWLALTPPLVRALGPEAFAVWSLFYALSFWLLALDLGLSQIAARFVAAARAGSRPETGGEFATLAVLGYLGLGLIWLALAPLAAPQVLEWLRVPPPLQADARLAILAGAAVFMMAGVVQSMLGILQAHERFDLAAVGLSITALLQGGGVMWGLMQHAGLGHMVLSVVAGWALGAVVVAILLQLGAPSFRWGSPARSLGHWREALAFGGPVQGANVLAVTHQQLDKLLLARMVALAAVTPYELGMRIASATASFPQFIMTAILPTATAMHARGDRESLAALYRRTTRWVLVVSALLASGLIGGAAPLLAAWLSRPAPEAAFVLQALALATFLASPAGTTSILARAAGRTRVELEWSAVALVVHLALALVAIPVFGLQGALLAMLMANAVSSVWFVVRLGRVLALPGGSILRDTFGAALFAVGVGSAIGLLADHAIGHSGAVSWPHAILVTTLASFACGLMLTLTRFVDLREAWALLRRGAPA